MTVILGQRIFAVLALAILGSPALAARVENPLFERLIRSLLARSVPEISVQRARDATACHWLDAREAAEFEVSHIAGALHVGYESFDPSSVADVDHGACVIVYCSIGYRSEKIGERLLAAGFTDVRNLYGGIFEWVNRGYPVVAAGGAVTTRIHAYGPTWGIWLRHGDKVY